MATIVDVDAITRIHRDTDARMLAERVYDRLLALLDELDEHEWHAQTECPAWTVADMTGHLIGAAKSHASMREQLRQQSWAARHRHEHGGNRLDAMNALQVSEHAHVNNSERAAMLRSLASAAVDGRMRTPGLLRRKKINLDTGGSTAEGMPATIRLGALMDVILSRDVWLHHLDIARAVGRSFDEDAEVDGRIVEDVVAEWARRHGQPFDLDLTGPAGGHFRRGVGGERIEMAALEFARILSGRAQGDGLLAVRVVF